MTIKFEQPLPTPDTLKNFCKEHPDLVRDKSDWELEENKGLHVIKYKPKTMYKNLWSECPEVLLNARGLVTDNDYNILSAPFPKTFNLEELSREDRPQLNDTVYVTKKINGFMGCVKTLTPEEYSFRVLPSTTGSLESDYVSYIKESLSTDQLFRYHHDEPDDTYIFEICHNKDPHVVQEVFGAYYLARRNVYSGTVTPYEDTLVKMTWGDVLNVLPHSKQEGYMIYHGGDSKCFKVKSPFYQLTKLLGRASVEKLEQLFGEDTYKSEWDKLLQKEQFKNYKPLQGVLEKLKKFDFYKIFERLDEQTRFAFIRDTINIITEEE